MDLISTVYTAIFSPYDTLKEPKVITPGWKYICYSDQPLKSPTWQIIKTKRIKRNARLTARHIKLLFHLFTTSERTLWIDASFEIRCDLDVFCNKFFKKDFSTILHPDRNCVYEELAACKKYKKDSDRILDKQARFYKKEGVPEKNGMISSGVLYRKRTEENIKFSVFWWNHLNEFSIRDQPAWAYSAYKLDLDYHIAPYNYRIQKDLRFRGHNL